MLNNSARKGTDHRFGIVDSHGNKNPWVSGMLLFGVFSLLALGSFALADNLAFAQDGTEESSGKTVLDALIDSGTIGLVIVLMSIVGGALSITFAFQLRRDVLVPPEVLAHLEALFEEGEVEDAWTHCEGQQDLLAAVVGAGLSKYDEGYEAMSDSMVEELEMESTKLHQKVGYLSLIANLSPMMGLLGTVFGMIMTFNKIATASVQPKPADLAAGISVALGTTFLGLCVAIPLTAIYVYFRNKVILVVDEVGSVSDELMARFKPE